MLVVLLPCCPVLVLCFCNVALLRYCDAAPLHCCNVALLRCCNIAMLRCFNVAPFYRFVVTPFFVHVFIVLVFWAFGLLGRPIPFDPGTNKRVKSSKRYPLRPRSTSFALIGPYHEPKKSLPLQREDYQFGIQVLGWKVVARGNSFLSRGDGFYLRRANSKMYFCPTNCGLSDEKLKPEVRVGYAPKSHKPYKIF